MARLRERREKATRAIPMPTSPVPIPSKGKAQSLPVKASAPLAAAGFEAAAARRDAGLSALEGDRSAALPPVVSGTELLEQLLEVPELVVQLAVPLGVQLFVAPGVDGVQLVVPLGGGVHPVWAGLVRPMPWLVSHSYPAFRSLPFED